MSHHYISIEGIPLITRFKTHGTYFQMSHHYISIEGIPLITRFKTSRPKEVIFMSLCIEGIPLIIRFKTPIS